MKVKFIGQIYVNCEKFTHSDFLCTASGNSQLQVYRELANIFKDNFTREWVLNQKNIEFYIQRLSNGHSTFITYK